VYRQKDCGWPGKGRGSWIGGVCKAKSIISFRTEGCAMLLRLGGAFSVLAQAGVHVMILCKACKFYYLKLSMIVSESGPWALKESLDHPWWRSCTSLPPVSDLSTSSSEIIPSATGELDFASVLGWTVPPDHGADFVI
jgi:hypothetical protein